MKISYSHICQKIEERKKFCSLKEENFIFGNKYLIFTDPKYGDFIANVRKVIHNSKEHPLRTSEKRKKIKYTVEYVKAELKKNFPFISIKEETFININKIATFYDEDFGEFKTRPYNVLKGHLHFRGTENRKKTMINRYGVEWYSQCKDFKVKIEKTYFKKYGTTNNMKHRDAALKNARSQNRYTCLYHWKTNEQVDCIASYEVAVVNYLNSNKIEYLWQPKVFKLENGKTYRPDLYLIMEDKWIEIKGYFRDDAWEKWNWFHSNYPNSELWNEKKLKEMSIL